MTWYAVLHLALTLATGQPYASIHGPFLTLASCRQFVRQFVRTYDDKASGARIRHTLCIAPGKKVVVLQTKTGPSILMPVTGPLPVD